MSSPRTRISRSRKVCFGFLTVIAASVVIEAGAALLLGLSQGRWPSLSLVAAERDAVLADDQPRRTNTPSLFNRGGNGPGNRLRADQSIHPYMGFTRLAGGDHGGNAHGDGEAGGQLEDRLFFEASEERVVVAVLGGSVADIVAAGGAGLAMELRKVDRFSGRQVVVISLAQAGFKQPQQLTALAYFLALGAHFDLVLNIDGFNEVALPATELLPRGVFPFYPRGWDQRLAPFDSAPRRVAADLNLSRRRRRDLARRFSARPWSASHTAALVWRALDTGAARSIASGEMMLLETRSDDLTYGSHGPRRSYDSSAAMYRDLAHFWRRASLQIHHLCRGQGIEYHHFLQPNQYLPRSKPVAAEQAAGTWLADHPYRLAIEQGYPSLIRDGRRLANLGVAFDDLSALFAERDELLYADSCCHLNFLGNTLLQRAIAHRLAGGAFTRPENVSDGGLALEGYDPVSYFDLQPIRGRAELTATHDGIRYRFANRDNRGRFLAAPERFLPRFGGWCAFGMGMTEADMGLPGERYPVDPESYEIVGGELFLFYRSPVIDARERWRRDREQKLRRAEETWQRLRAETR